MKKRKSTSIDPNYLRKEREALRRKHRKAILFNDREMAAIDEYCSRFKVASRSALIREAVIEHIMKSLDETSPTLF